MTSSTIATWAEPVRWTADDLLRLSDAGFRFELVKGELVRMAPTGGSLGLRTGRLHGVLSAYVGTHGLGEVAAAETGFDLTQPGDAAQTVLAPDIAFVRSENVPCERGPDRHAGRDRRVDCRYPAGAGGASRGTSPGHP